VFAFQYEGTKRCDSLKETLLHRHRHQARCTIDLPPSNFSRSPPVTTAVDPPQESSSPSSTPLPHAINTMDAQPPNSVDRPSVEGLTIPLHQQPAKSLLDILSLYPIFSNICSRLTIAELITLRKLSKRLHGDLDSHEKQRWDINTRLRRFLWDPVAFRSQVSHVLREAFLSPATLPFIHVLAFWGCRGLILRL
jgi:hypothetical protein